MIRLIFAILITFSSSSFAKIHIIEIASFNCKYCLETEKYTDNLKYHLNKNGDRFVFAPIDTNDNNTDELFYYALKDHPTLEPIVRQSLFTMSQTLDLTMDYYEEIADWMSIYLNDPKITREYLINELKPSVSKADNKIAFLKAHRLVEKLNIENTPTFVIVDEIGNISAPPRPLKSSLEEYTLHIIDTYKRMKKSEQ